jgi:hypothetical protein
MVLRTWYLVHSITAPRYGLFGAYTPAMFVLEAIR